MNSRLNYKLPLLVLFLISAAVSAAPFKNGNFEKGKSKWKGDGEVIEEKDGNKVLKFTLDKEKQTVELQFDAPSKARKAIVTYRVKSKSLEPADPDMKGWRFIWVNKKNLLISPHPAAKEGEWVTITSKNNIPAGLKRVGARFVIDPGTGTLFFDDVSVIFER